MWPTLQKEKTQSPAVCSVSAPRPSGLFGVAFNMERTTEEHPCVLTWACAYVCGCVCVFESKGGKLCVLRWQDFLVINVSVCVSVMNSAKESVT